MKNSNKAFTLVELIVVIVILAILATIAFLSFSSQSASARDSTRLSDMNNIAKGLSVNFAISGKYPLPDNKVNINASGTTTLYQGYAGLNVLNMIKLSNGGKDPLDTSTFYTYATNAGQNKFQILGFLEDGSNTALSLMPFKGSQASADPASYSGRYVITKGDQLGILLESSTKVPVQSQSALVISGLDILSTNTSYTMYYSKTESITGTGAKLRGTVGGSGLVGYWNFDDGVGTGAKDQSGNGNDGILTGSTIPTWTGGKVGGSLYFNGGFVDAGNSSSLQIPENVSFAFWIKMPSNSSTGVFVPFGKYASASPGCADASGIEEVIYLDNSGKYSAFFGGRNCSGIYARTDIDKVLNDNQWHFIAGIKYGKSWTNYVDDIKKEYLSEISGNINAFNRNLVIGAENNSGGYKINGQMDEVRIYNRALTNTEMQAIYNSTK